MRIPAIPCLWLLLASLRAQGDQLAAARAALAAAEQQHGAASVAALQARLQVASQLFKAGQLQPARAELRPAIAQAQALGDARLESAGRLMLAAVLTDLQDLPAARAEAEAGLLLRRRELPAGHAAIAEACNSLASVLAAIGDLAGARPLFDEARAGFAKAPGQGMRAAMVSNNLAALAARELDYPAAIEHATAAVAMATQARGENDRTTLQLRSNLGRALISVGRLDSARALLERVLAAQQQQLGERHLRTFETELALLGLRMTTLPEASAIADAERLQATAVELFGARHATTRGVEWLLIEAQRRAGQLQAALAGVEGQRAQGSAGETIERSLVLLQARLVAELGRHGEAAKLCDELEAAALGRSDPMAHSYELTLLAQVHALGGRRSRAIALARQVLDDTGIELTWTLPLLRIRSQLAEWLVAEGDRAAAVRLDIDSLSAFGVALDATLPSLLEPERLRQKAELQSCLDRLLEADANDLTDRREVFAAILAWKGCVGRELEADLAALRERARGPHQALRDRLQQVQRTLGELLERGSEGSAEWSELLREQAAVQNRLSEHAAGGSQPPAAGALEQALPKNSALVEFVAWRRRGTPWLTAFVLASNGALQRIELGEVATLAQAVTAHLQVLARRVRPLDAAGATLAAAAANRVRALCWQPLEAALGACERVYLAGDDCLLLLPFDTLPAEGGSLLLERLDLRQLRSGLDLLLPERSPRGDLLLVDGAGADLPGAHAEVAAIAAAWRQYAGSAATTLDGTDADALQQAAALAGYVHIAAHGRLQLGAAEHGASLELGGQRLSAAELAWFDLGRTGLVVLSACDTARGSVVAGEHLLGLRRALRLAGAAASVTALWRIDDEATAAFMVSFWTEIARGAMPAEALRRSKVGALAAARQQHRDPLPGRWAAFVLEGH